MITVLTGFSLFLVYFIYRGNKNTHSFDINHIEIGRNPKNKNNSLLRILHISDMHLENISITPEQLYENLKNHPIDLIALTGDFLDRKKNIPKLKPYLQVLNQLQPTYGVYAVFGNHDYLLRTSSFNLLKETLHEYEIKTLQNENDVIQINGKPLNIIGVDNYSTSHDNLDKAYLGVENGYNLVFTHDPNIVLTMEKYHFDYLLSGHFHGGQIHWPKPYHLYKMGKLVRMNMVKGLHHYNGKPFYISEGLGQTGINIRVGSSPEITIHDVFLYEENEIYEDAATTIAG